MRLRLAPSATLTVISRCLVVARDNSRFETFAHAMSSSSPTAPKSTQRSPMMPLRKVSEKRLQTDSPFFRELFRLALLEVRDDRLEIGFRLRVRHTRLRGVRAGAPSPRLRPAGRAGTLSGR